MWAFFYAKNIKKRSGNIIPATASFHPLRLNENLPAGIIIVPVIAIQINDNPNISEK